MKKKDFQLIVPMSGLGRRFLNADYDVPKPLICVDGEPMIKHVVKLFPGVDDIIFICNQNHLDNTNMKKVLLDNFPGAKILSTGYNKDNGPVDTIYKVINEISDNKKIIISYCDYSSVWEFEKFCDFVSDEDIDGCIVCYTGFHPHMIGKDNYAFVKKDQNFVSEVREKKPFTLDRMSEEASNGTYFFKNKNLVKKYFEELLNYGPEINGEYYVSLVYNKMIKDNLKVKTFMIEKMLQWGTPFDLETYKNWSSYFSNKNDQEKVYNPKNTTLLLPMAGRGSRFTELGYQIPKPFLPVDGKPMVIEAVKNLPISDKQIFISLKEHCEIFGVKTTIEKNFKNSNIIEIDEITEGQAITCKIAFDKNYINLEEPLMISACDNGVLYDASEYKKLLQDNSIDIIVWSFRNNQTTLLNPQIYSWLEVDNQNLVKKVYCKKFIFDNPLKSHAIIGTIFFRKAKFFLDGLNENISKKIKTNNEYYVDDVLTQNLNMNLKIKVFEVKNYICWGTPNDYKTYNYWFDYFTKK